MNSLFQVGQIVELKKACHVPLGQASLSLSDGLIGTVQMALGGMYWVKFKLSEGVMLVLKIPEVDLSAFAYQGITGVAGCTPERGWRA